MRLQNDLKALQEANVISAETAERIRAYYEAQRPDSANRLFIAFGILGALLVGLGIILIVAHNWDNLSRNIKSIFAFIPLLIGQALCAYTLLKRKESKAWRETSALLVFFGIGTSIALISQIYHLPGAIENFLFTWAVLALPLMYVMRSSMVSLLYLAGITWYATEEHYYAPLDYCWYWLLFLGALPYYYQLYRHSATSNFMSFHNWMVPGSLAIALGMFSDKDAELMFLAYINLFAVFYLIGNARYLKKQSILKNGYRVIAALGTVGILLALSFYWFWEELQDESFTFGSEAILSILLGVLALVFLFLQIRKKAWEALEPLSTVFLFFTLIFLIGWQGGLKLAAVLINLLIFGIGVLTIRKGAKEDHLGILNYGLIIITLLTVCRFFDVNLSFVHRGILFVLIGIGFFVANYLMLQKRKSHES